MSLLATIAALFGGALCVTAGTYLIASQRSVVLGLVLVLVGAVLVAESLPVPADVMGMPAPDPGN